jgi:hypothetical protein
MSNIPVIKDSTLMRRLFACLVFLILHCGSSMAGEYHGFQIDDRARQLAPEALASLTAQLDVVEAVGLPPGVLDALRQTPIVVDPDLRGQPGIFAVRRDAGAVYVRPIVFDANKPILLHELLHAYHFRVLHMDRPEIEQAYEQAKGAGLYPARFQSAHFLENGKEFFAVTGTLYLFGDIQQPPFRCVALDKLPPAYLAFLAQQFGPHQCRTNH